MFYLALIEKTKQPLVSNSLKSMFPFSNIVLSSTSTVTKIILIYLFTLSFYIIVEREEKNRKTHILLSFSPHFLIKSSVKEKYKKLSVEIILLLFANLHIQKDDESCKLPFNQHCIRLLNVRSEIFIFGSLSSASRVGCTSLTACYSFFNVLTNLAFYVLLPKISKFVA